MKLKLVIVDFETPPAMKRRALRIALPLLILLGGAGLAYAATVHVWTKNDVLTADDLNGSFQALQDQITTLQGKLASTQVLSYTSGSTTKRLSTNGLLCGVSSQLTSGAISNTATTHTGYLAAKEICEQVPACGGSSTAHMCSNQEMINSYQLGIAPLQTAWIATMTSSGTSASADLNNDCLGFSRSVNDTLGTTATNDLATGRPGAASCDHTFAIACCDNAQVQTTALPAPRSQISSFSGVALGSTDTAILRFNQDLVVGTAITSNGGTAANGNIYTIQEDGIYSMTAMVRTTSGGSDIAILRNATGTYLTNDPDNFGFSASGDQGIIAFGAMTGSGTSAVATVTLFLKASDTIRVALALQSGNALTGPSQDAFTITKVSN